MHESPTVTSDLASQYTAQVTNDLERNIQEQERISAEIAVLQEQLTGLQRDHSVLLNVHQALGIAPPPEPGDTSNRHTVPVPRKKATTGTNKKVRKKSASNKSSPVAAVNRGQSTLIDLVHKHLAEQSAPRSAAEVATSLDQVHPERGIKTTVVRTTLENLVAKGQAQRTKQGNSVFYTTPAERNLMPESEEVPESAA